MTRFELPSMDDLPAETAAAIRGFPVTVNAVMMLGHAPTLTGPLLDLVTAMLTSLDLSPRHREMLILLVSRETGCEYEWVQHLPQARRVGVRTDELSWIRDPGLTSPDPADNVLLRCGRRYLRDHKWDQDDVDDLREHFTVRQIAEMLLVLGACRTFTLFLNVLEADLDPAGEELAIRFAALTKSKT